MPATTMQASSNELVCTDIPSKTLPGSVRVLLNAYLRERCTAQQISIPGGLISGLLLAASGLVAGMLPGTSDEIIFKVVVECRLVWIGGWDSFRREPRPAWESVELDDINCLEEGYELSISVAG